jgi:anti-sigma-K factor RskA
VTNPDRSDQRGAGLERLDDLLLEHALFGLSEAGEREVGEARTSPEALEYELGAAAVAVALSSERMRPLSELLRAKLQAGAKAYFAATPAASRWEASRPNMSTSQRGSAPLELARATATNRDASKANAVSYAGWFVAAAAAVLAIVAWWPTTSSTPTPAEQRTLLLARADAQTVAAKGQAPFAPSASGDVVWSGAAQAGFLRLVGAPVNDPAVQQYQLWIFDQAQEHPVDGGVFDVPASGEVLIPIDAKLRVSKPTLFAITLEKPGGVVVSDRQRIAIVAAL